MLLSFWTIFRGSFLSLLKCHPGPVGQRLHVRQRAIVRLQRSGYEHYNSGEYYHDGNDDDDASAEKEEENKTDLRQLGAQPAD